MNEGARLTFQLASLVASDRFDPLAKTNFSLARRRTFFYFKIPIHDFTNKIICSTITLYVAKIGIDVIITYIGVAQQRKPKYSLPGEILTELLNSPPKNIPFYQKAVSQFLVNTIIHFIITYFQVANIGIDII